MAELYDADGNLVEGALTSDEVKAIQAKADEAAAEANSAKEKLSKMENKEFNFKKLRDLSEEERKKLSTKEMELMQRQEDLETKTKGFVETQINTHKDEALAVLAGDNEELRKKTMFHYDRIKDEATSREDIRRKMRDAFRLAQGDVTGTNDPFSSAVSYSGGSAPNAKPASADFSNDQKDLAKKLGLSEDDLKKYNH
jgi:hypothetical protein